MGFIYVQFKSEQKGKKISQDWKKCNPVSLRYQQLDETKIHRPFLVLYIQLGPATINKTTRVKAYFESEINESKQEKKKKQEAASSSQTSSDDETSEFDTDTEPSLPSSQPFLSSQMVDYLKDNQLLLYTRGIDHRVFACLTVDEANALRELAFAQVHLKQALKDDIMRHYESVAELQLQKNTNILFILKLKYKS